MCVTTFRVRLTPPSTGVTASAPWLTFTAKSTEKSDTLSIWPHFGSSVDAMTSPSSARTVALETTRMVAESKDSFGARVSR